MINSLTLFNIKSLPSIVLINSSNTMYHIFEPKGELEDNDGEQLFKEQIMTLIQDIKSHSLPFSGGNDIWTRVKRRSYDGVNNLISMYQGNPVLTLLIFGLPFTFLSFIIYSTCFSDILDSSEDQEDDLDEDGKIMQHFQFTTYTHTYQL